jgi:hypothetical protein
MPTLAKCATLNTAAELAEVGKRLNLETFLKEARLTTINMLVKTFQDAPALAKAFDEFHGLGVIKEAIAAAAARDAQPKIASVLSEAPKKPELLPALRSCHASTRRSCKPSCRRTLTRRKSRRSCCATGR